MTPERVQQLLEEHERTHAGRGAPVRSNDTTNETQSPADATPPSLPSKLVFRPTGIFAKLPKEVSLSSSTASSVSCEVEEVTEGLCLANPRVSPGTAARERVGSLFEPRAGASGEKPRGERPEDPPPSCKAAAKKHRSSTSTEKLAAASRSPPRQKPEKGSPSGRRGSKPAEKPVPRKPVEYTPATVDDYKALMERYATQRPARSLGPDDSDEQRRARERKEKERAYGKAVERAALGGISGTPKAPSEGPEKTENDEGAEKANNAPEEGGAATPHSTPVSPRSQKQSPQPDTKAIRQPPSKEFVRARKRRQRALNYGKAVEQKQLEQYQQRQEEQAARLAEEREGHLGDSDERDDYCAKEQELMARLGRGHEGRPETMADVEAAQRRQKLADLEARHEQSKAAVDAIRRQFASRA